MSNVQDITAQAVRELFDRHLMAHRGSAILGQRSHIYEYATRELWEKWGTDYRFFIGLGSGPQLKWIDRGFKRRSDASRWAKLHGAYQITNWYSF
jgi:hypothetical protein